MKILHLTLKKKWFDMIASGEKLEEYREIKPYWWKRLVKPGLHLSTWMAFPDPSPEFQPFTHVLFRHGYAHDAPFILARIESIYIAVPESEWCEPGDEDDVFFTIKIGAIEKMSLDMWLAPDQPTRVTTTLNQTGIAWKTSYISPGSE